MKTIGIKLADGSFYPVLQEDVPAEKKLELTTAHNDQTRVMVDLYRTKTGTMEEAEYVDTLRIDNLEKHPSGEPDISFIISIDGNNELSARIVDTETGASSDTTIELVNRTLEERLEADPTESEYAINDATGEGTEGLPEFDDSILTDTPVTTEETPFDMPDDTTSSSDESFNTADLDLPDFDNDTFAENPTSNDDIFADTSSSDSNFNSADLDLPDFGDDPFATDTSNDDDIFGESSSTPVAAPMNGGMFDGLYDTGDFDKPEEETKKTKAPVIICIICAIICIVAVLLIFFVIPSKINLLGKTGNSEVAPVEKVEPAPAPIPEPEPEPVVPSAKEDEIVVIEKAEEVKPEPPAPPAPKPKPDIIYKVKWGDTLWDIADTYYKNPWRYIKIANYNGIRNPDYIISGTTILIPQE